MLNRFHLIPERIGQTDRQTDRFVISISRVSMLTRDKKNCARGIVLLTQRSKLLKETKHRAASLRQQSYLLASSLVS